MFDHLPKNRALTNDAKAKAAKLLEIKGNKKMIQQQLSSETGKVVLLKDLTNLSASLKKGKTRNDLDATVKMLMEKYGKLACTYT